MLMENTAKDIVRQLVKGAVERTFIIPSILGGKTPEVSSKAYATKGGIVSVIVCYNEGKVHTQFMIDGEDSTYKNAVEIVRQHIADICD